MSDRRSVRLSWTFDVAVLAVARTAAVVLGLGYLWGVEADEGTVFAAVLLAVAFVATAIDLVAPSLASTPITESIIAGGLIGFFGAEGDFFLPYLTIPAIAAGLRAGPWLGLAASVTGTGAMVLARITDGGDSAPGLLWGATAAAGGLLAGWLHRARQRSDDDESRSYQEAGRLLEQLRPLLRPMAGGLDPRPLASRLLEETQAIAPDSSAAVLLHRPEATLIAASTGEPPPEGWLHPPLNGHGSRLRRDRAATWVYDFTDNQSPVASLVVLSRGPLSADERRRLPALARAWRPHMLAAALFEDVRELATMAERGRIAREMHDSVAQDIASLGYLVDDLAEITPPDAAQALGELREEIGRIVTELRLSIHDLRPDGLAGGGLGGTIAEIARRETRAADCTVHLRLQETRNLLSPAVENELARIAQEALTNVRRHAQAQNVWVSSVVGPGGVVICVEDDGRGMRPGTSNGLGIVSMTERAVRIGALFSIESRSPSGTCVRVEMPVQAPGISPTGQIPVGHAG